MNVDKLSVSFDRSLGHAVRASAKRSGRPVSGWLAEAATDKLRREAFDEFLAAWEAEHGPITGAELGAARSRLGLAGTSGTSAA